MGEKAGQKKAETINPNVKLVEGVIKVLVVDDDNGQRMVTPPGTLNLALKLKP